MKNTYKYLNIFLFKKYFDEFRSQNIPIVEMSTLNEDGVILVRNEACERLLAHRVELKVKTSRVNDVLNRLHLAEPVKRDGKERPAFIPAAVLKKRETALATNNEETESHSQSLMEIEKPHKKLERELELEMGRDYKIDLRSKRIL
jgi:nucleolar GTP-binding protein